ncbi:sigma-70 family RNA polymerase sigma factor [Apilactobacillus xinyiensis]|uniref:Sigma-70 family RNA polymerase sigma factor n=1 Tax=Apilactobacillus xinyiensis TaxID=2841032 RepID=A0ABT0I364_9LACO|nr:sigma-70 family RNA polymerase sigma factor [Apilactobacillus xinyiensis]MCK8625180.1 sigma-70 family RNA polymerase sigma factor [Apilactobacillus xinyiensis]MCL0318925.1 sigma-70 family RNA polymerase sigma factor [Apilactobacillus xinyiensis]
MNDNHKYAAGFNYLMEGDHQVLIHGVLKRLNIRHFNQHYDDLFQEGVLAFVQKYEQCPVDKTDKQRLGFIYQGVYWHLLDYLRKDSLVDTRQENDDTEIAYLPASDDSNALIERKLLLQKLQIICTKKELSYLYNRHELRMPVTKMAEQENISRQSMHKRLNKLYQKIKLNLGVTHW